MSESLVIFAVGACQPNARELHEGVIARAGQPIVADSVAGVSQKAGDLLAPGALTALKKNKDTLHQSLLPLHAIVDSGYTYLASSLPACVVFKSVGFGAQDLALAIQMHRLAQKEVF